MSVKAKAAAGESVVSPKRDARGGEHVNEMMIWFENCRRICCAKDKKKAQLEGISSNENKLDKIKLSNFGLLFSFSGISSGFFSLMPNGCHRVFGGVWKNFRLGLQSPHDWIDRSELPYTEWNPKLMTRTYTGHHSNCFIKYFVRLFNPSSPLTDKNLRQSNGREREETRRNTIHIMNEIKCKWPIDSLNRLQNFESYGFSLPSVHSKSDTFFVRKQIEWKNTLGAVKKKEKKLFWFWWWWWWWKEWEEARKEGN